MPDELAADGNVDGCFLLITSDHPHLSTHQAKTVGSKVDTQNGAPSFVGGIHMETLSSAREQVMTGQ